MKIHCGLKELEANPILKEIDTSSKQDHGFRKWFKTRCEIAGMKSINIETLMGHSIGISDSYYRATEEELLTDYLKAVGHLTMSNEHNLKKEFRQAMDKFKSNYDELNSELGHREQEIRILQQNDFSNSDAIAPLGEKLMEIFRENREPYEGKMNMHSRSR